jgi:hypothetical protein
VKDNQIFLFTFSTHTSQLLKLLDVGVYCPYHTQRMPQSELRALRFQSQDISEDTIVYICDVSGSDKTTDDSG